MELIYVVVILVGTMSVLTGAQELCICTSQADIDTLEARLQNIEKLNKALQIQLNEITSTPKTSDKQKTDSVSTYTKWGKKKCTLNGTRIIYNGYAAGGHYGHVGRSPSMLCLPRNPHWAKYDERENDLGCRVYGVEYNTNTERANAILGTGSSVHNRDLLCAVCESDRSAHIMIPGRKNCYPGWTREYWGYLMSNHYNHTSAGEYYCVDSQPDVLDSVVSHQHGYRLYFVEVRCESLRCPPYVKGRELPCAVCTK